MYKLTCYLILLLPFSSNAQKDSIRIIDINKAAYKVISVGVKPDFIAIDGNDAWVVDDHQSRVIKISPDSEVPLLIVPIPEACTAPIVGFKALWVMSCTGKILYRIDHTSGIVLAKIATGMAEPNGEMSLAVGDGSVWLLSDSAGVLIRVDPKTNTVQAKITVLPNSYGLAFGHHSIWVTNYQNNSVQRINPKTNKVVATIAAGSKPRFITATNKGVWTLNQGDGTVSEIDPKLNKLVATIDVKAIGSGGDIAAGLDKVYVVSTNPLRPVQTIDVRTNLIETIYLQKTADGKMAKTDGAVRISGKYIYISGYFSKKIWILKK
ncbi:MAG: hypothetical protein H7296_02700 [Bacteroidia bacterium]|nr:hypothetical protein [Bacteroidia bacterium]